MAGVTRVNKHNVPPGTFSLEGDELYALTPTSIRYGQGKAMIANHATGLQLLKDNSAVLIHQAARLLMQEVRSLVVDTSVYLSNCLFRLVPTVPPPLRRESVC